VSIEEAIAARLSDLITSGESLAIGNEHGQVYDEDHRRECSAWLVAAQNAAYALIKDGAQPYRQQIDRICSKSRGYTLASTIKCNTRLRVGCRHGTEIHTLERRRTRDD